MLEPAATPVSDPKIGRQLVQNEKLDLGITVEEKPKTDTKPIVNQAEKTNEDIETKPVTEKPEPHAGLTPPPLLILDLNGCLVHRTYDPSYGRRVTTRPHLDQLFNYALGPDPDRANLYRPNKFRNWEVLIWSSAQSQNVSTMCQAIQVSKRGIEVRKTFKSKKAQADVSGQLSDISNQLGSLSLKAAPAPAARSENSKKADDIPRTVLDIWDRSKLDLSSEDYNRKVQTTKDLRKVWDKFTWFDPTTGEDVKWGPHNTLIVDDSPDKLSLQPDNLYVIPEFTGDSNDKAILDLVEKLKSLKGQPDIPTALKNLK